MLPALSGKGPFQDLLSFAQSNGAAPELSALQEDPNFYQFLDDLMGSDNEEDMASNALTTLADFKQQYAYQQSHSHSSNVPQSHTTPTPPDSSEWVDTLLLSQPTASTSDGSRSNNPLQPLVVDPAQHVLPCSLHQQLQGTYQHLPTTTDPSLHSSLQSTPSNPPQSPPDSSPIPDAPQPSQAEGTNTPAAAPLQPDPELAAISKPKTKATSHKALMLMLQRKREEMERLTQENKMLQMKAQIMEIACNRQQICIRALTPKGAAGQAATLPSSDTQDGDTTNLTNQLPDASSCLDLFSEDLAHGDVEWARACTASSYAAYWKEQLRAFSELLLAAEQPNPVPGALCQIEHLLRRHMQRNALLTYVNPAMLLKMRGTNIECSSPHMAASAPDEHWDGVVRNLGITRDHFDELLAVFQASGTLHAVLGADLQEFQGEFNALIQKLSPQVGHAGTAQTLDWDLQAIELLSRIRRVLQKMNVLYSATLIMVTMRVFKPLLFAKLCVRSYPYLPCAKACIQAMGVMLKVPDDVAQQLLSWKTAALYKAA